MLLKHEMGIKNPDKLSDTEFAKAYQDFLYLQKVRHDFQLNILRKAIQEAFGKTEINNIDLDKDNE